MSLKFGTDGVRGVANTELTPELALTLSRAAARVLGGRQWVIGRDTRRSGTLLAGALAAGLASEGIDVVDLGVLPTPGVAHVSAVDGVAAAMISASHNPFADNGIKVFAAGGRKLSDEVEEQLRRKVVHDVEAEVLEHPGNRRAPGPAHPGDEDDVDREPTKVDRLRQMGGSVGRCCVHGHHLAVNRRGPRR